MILLPICAIAAPSAISNSLARTLPFGLRKVEEFAVGESELSLSVAATNGTVQIKAGTSKRVVIKSVILADKLSKLSQTTLDSILDGSHIRLNQVDHLIPNPISNESPGIWTSYSPPIIKTTVEVPSNTELSIETTNADIDVQGIRGNVDISSTNGNIRFEAQSNHSEGVFASTHNGKLESAVPVFSKDSSAIRLQSYNGSVSVSRTATPTALLGGKFFDGNRFVRQDWFVVDGLLTRHRPVGDLKLVNLHGKFVSPAYGDAHCHHFEGEYFSRLMSKKYLAEGTLFAQSMANHVSQKAGANKVVNQPDGMDVAFADAGFTATGGHPTFTYELLANPTPANFTYQQRSDALKSKRTQLGDVYWITDKPEQVDEAWPKYLSSDPDLVKIFLVNSADREKNFNGLMGTYGLDPSIAPLIVKRAHESGLRVYAHVDTALDMEIALKSGVDGMGHLPGYGYSEGSPEPVTITPEIARLASGHYIQLTLGISEGYNHGDLGKTRRLQTKNIATLRTAGAIPIIGSDSYGSTSANDVKAWLAVGQSPLQLMRALSRDTPQSIFPGRRIGEIREGYEADLVILDKNPLDFPSAMLSASEVIKQGRVIYSLDPHPIPNPRPPLPAHQ